MLKKIKDLKISIVQMDVFDWIALIISILCLIVYDKDDNFRIPILVFSIINIGASSCFIFPAIYVRIKYKIKNKRKIPREYYFKRDIESKDDLFKCHILLGILLIILILFFTLSIIF